jgi:hypothetical protein
MNIEDHPVRKCSKCSRPEARVVATVRHLYGGNPVGETYDHQCFACGATFRTQSPRRLLGELSTWLFLNLLGLAILGFGVFYIYDVISSFASGYGYFRVSIILVPVLSIGLGGALTRFVFQALKEAFEPVRSHFQNPVTEQPR